MKKLKEGDIVKFFETREGENCRYSYITATVKQIGSCGFCVMIIPWNSGREHLTHRSSLKYVRKGIKNPWGYYE